MQTLRAFGAAGRLQSYTKAAEALGITHGAISHRIRDLEQEMDATLFERVGHTMVPTAKAYALLAQVRQILSLLDSTFQLRSGATSLQLTKEHLILSVLPAFASHWLIKRLPDFDCQYPDISVELRVSPDLTNLASSDVDAVIRYGPGRWQGAIATKLCDEILFPVCSLLLLEKYTFAMPADILAAPLLRSSWQPWTPWLMAAGIEAAGPNFGSQFFDVGLMLQAAVAGNGIALARGLLVGDLLDLGVLVRLFDVSVQDIYGYYLVAAENKPRSKALRKFENWLTSNDSFQT